MKTEGPCPGRADLRDLLNGALPAGAEARLTEHLDGCPPCQQTLESLAAGTGVSPAPGRPGGGERPAFAEALQRAMAELKAGPRKAGRLTETFTGDELVLSFLAPSEEAAR